jgi:hypothetical protein
MKFSDIPFQPYNSSGSYGKTARIRFDNDYELSIVQIFDDLNGNSHGADEGLYEAALLKDKQMCYNTRITGFEKKVIGFLDESDVEKLIDEVNKL